MSTELHDATDSALLEMFAEGLNQRAFEELVKRHGQMVMGVCRRVLGQHQDAEDAVQATFLALAAGAAKIRRRAAVTAWLHQTAIRSATTIKRKRIRHEQQLKKMQEVRVKSRRPDQRLQAMREVLDDEIGKLPSHLRVAVVLCDLEGLTRKVAAGRLGIPPATMAGHVLQGRKLLANRLVRHDVTFSVVGLTKAMAKLSDGAPIDSAFAYETTKAAMQVAAQGIEHVGVSNAMTTVATHALQNFAVAKVIAVAVVAVIASVTGGAWYGGLLGAPSVSTRQAEATVPIGLSEIDGNSNLFNSTPAIPAAFRMQQLYLAGDFPAGKHTISGMSWRPDKDVTQRRRVAIRRLDVSLSTTSATPGDGLSSILSRNIGPDALVVHSGRIVFDTPGESERDSDGPQPFDYQIEFTEPFVYDTRKGNLLVDITLHLPAFRPGTLAPRVDAQRLSDIHSLVVRGPNPSATSADVREKRVIVTRFELLPVPNASATTKPLAPLPSTKQEYSTLTSSRY